MWWKDTTLLVLVATFAALVVVLFRRGGSCQRRAAYQNGDDDYEDSGVDCAKVTKDGVDGSKFKELERYLKNSAKKGRTWKSAFEKDPKKGAEAKCWVNKDGGRLMKAYASGEVYRGEMNKTVAARSANCQFGKCPNTVLRGVKPCRASDKNGGYSKCCEDTAGTVDCVPHKSTDKNWDCQNVPFSERECTPQGDPGDYKKYCYNGTESHNRGKCCKQPWSGACKDIKGASEPAPANSTDNTGTVPADDPVAKLKARVEQCKCSRNGYKPEMNEDRTDAACVMTNSQGKKSYDKCDEASAETSAPTCKCEKDWDVTVKDGVEQCRRTINLGYNRSGASLGTKRYYEPCKT